MTQLMQMWKIFTCVGNKLEFEMYVGHCFFNILN